MSPFETNLKFKNLCTKNKFKISKEIEKKIFIELSINLLKPTSLPQQSLKQYEMSLIMCRRLHLENRMTRIEFISFTFLVENRICRIGRVFTLEHLKNHRIEATILQLTTSPPFWQMRSEKFRKLPHCRPSLVLFNQPISLHRSVSARLAILENNSRKKDHFMLFNVEGDVIVNYF